jgi:hypothetical protein
VRDGADLAGLPARHRAGRAFVEQHLDDALAALVAEQLPTVLLVPADAMAREQRREIGGRVSRQRRATEVRIPGDEVFRAGGAVGEVAPPAARDADLFGRLLGVVDQQDLEAALAGDARTEHPGGTSAQNDRVKHAWLAVARLHRSTMTIVA